MAYSKQTWVRGEKVASTKLNHMEDGIAAISANGAIDTANLANAAVTNDKLDQEAVDSNNIRTGAIITPLIYDGAVTLPKLGADVIEELDNKADFDGSYESMTVGNAEQLVSTVGVEDSAPYTFRTTGGSADVGDRMNLKAVVGGTVAWNQLVQTNSASVTVPNAHKYLSRINGTNTIAISNGSAISINDGTKDNVFDLTQMLGSTIADYIYALEQSNAGSGVAYFKKLFPKPYYAYNSGELLSVKTSAHRMVGFNQWDEEYALGFYSANGVFANNTSGYMSNKYPIKVVPNTTYCMTIGKATSFYLCMYDADGSFIKRETRPYQLDERGRLFTTEANCNYICFSTYPQYGTTYNHDICINLSWDGERNGEYEPYEAHEYALDDITLRGILKLDASNNLYADGDRYLPDGTVERRYGIVDLGTLNWDKYDVTQGTLFRSAGNAFPALMYDDIDFICTPYVTVKASQRAEKTVSCGSNRNIDIIDSSYSDAATFKTAMSGVYLVYELATPTTETADPYQQTQIVDDFGTEEFVDAAVEANERDVAVPVGNITFYPQNLRKKIEGLPFDFSTLIARTEKKFKATKAYAVNEFMIINNQLYKVRTSIANGATITVGTNVIATTIGAELTAILNS